MRNVFSRRDFLKASAAAVLAASAAGVLAKASGYGSFKQGVPFKLYVTLQGRTAEFALTSDGKVTVSAVDKV